MIYIFTLLLIWALNMQLHPGCSNGNGLTGIEYTKNRLVYCVIIGVWFFLLLVLRHAYVGTDTQNYYLFYRQIATHGFKLQLQNSELSTEFGFFYLNHLLNSVGLPFRSLLVVSAGFYMFTMSYLIYKYSQRPAISYFVFMMFGYFIFNTTMRQCFAISFCIWATIFVIRNKKLLALAFCGLAMLFHATAIIFIPALFVKFLNYNWKSFWLMLAVTVFISGASAVIFSAMAEITGKTYEVRAATGYVSFIFSVIVLIIGFTYRYRIPNINRIWFYMMAISAILFPLASLNPAVFRIRLYFSVFMIIYIANLSQPRFKLTPLLLAMVFTYGSYQFFIGTKLAGIRTLPYVFYWEDYYQYNPDVRNLKLSKPDS